MQGIVITQKTRDAVKRKQIKELMDKYGINENAAMIIRFIKADRQNGFTNSEISDGTGLNPHAVTGVVNSLVKKGLVKRTEDKRVVLTEQKED